jgi:phosphatidylserine/phosphatidylglycerophosphate/cardiolipin synthase-like enzyme
VAFVGGIDLCHGRNDDEDHLGDPQAIALDRRYGPRPAWHDTQLEIRGPAVGDLLHTFRERWEDPSPLDHRNPWRAAIHRKRQATGSTESPAGDARGAETSGRRRRSRCFEPIRPSGPRTRSRRGESEASLERT